MDQSKLIIVGDKAFAEIAFEYFTHDTPYEVVAFTVERDFFTRQELFGLPIVPFEEVENAFEPAQHRIFVALTYARLNRVRTRLFEAAKKKGYQAVTYVSSKAFVWHNVEIGDNCFVFENNVIQPYVKIGDNCIFWSGNHIGHHSTIGAGCFISSHAVVSGYVEIGDSCFLGINSSIGNNLKIAPDCVIGAGALILRDTEENKVYRGTPALPGEQSSKALFGVEE